jgi:3-deoxy-manno-octulosonate cytidylyltransferase (CMP-KDO synthetase)
MTEEVIGVIPARYASTRLPGKPLIIIAGKPLIQWVWEAVQRCKSLNDIIIATDDHRIVGTCNSFGAKVVMTSPDCATGSDRIAEAVTNLPHQVVVNIQGDEPLIDPQTIDACVAALIENSAAGVSSAMTPFQPHEDYREPHMVKVVTSSRGHAMYFSRAPIPDMTRLSKEESSAAPVPMKHVGLYVYRREVLDQFVKLPPSQYEQLEKLEQLRLLEAGITITMVEIASAAIGVDTPQDVELVEKLLARN